MKRAIYVIAALLVIGGAAYGGYWYGTNHATKPTSGAQSNSNESNNAAGSATANQSATSQNEVAKLADACSHLALSKGTSEGTAGTIYWHAVITNNGSQDCSLAGYPAATMTDAAGASVTAASNPLYAVQLVTLTANGGQAHVALGLPDPSLFDPGTTTCTQQSSGTLHLDLPGLTTAVQAPFAVSACAGFTVTALKTGV